jgi:hypothetical protein
MRSARPIEALSLLDLESGRSIKGLPSGDHAVQSTRNPRGGKTGILGYYVMSYQ